MGKCFLTYALLASSFNLFEDVLMIWRDGHFLSFGAFYIFWWVSLPGLFGFMEVSFLTSSKNKPSSSCQNSQWDQTRDYTVKRLSFFWEKVHPNLLAWMVFCYGISIHYKSSSRSAGWSWSIVTYWHEFPTFATDAV